MSEYDIVMVTQTPIDLNNASSCIPVEQFMAMLPNIVLKQDAINLGLLCFVIGLIVMWCIERLYERYGHGSS
jgi:hypothetical protein